MNRQDKAAGLLAQAKTELRRAERAVAGARRLVAAAADELDGGTDTHKEGHRDDSSTGTTDDGREPARAAA